MQKILKAILTLIIFSFLPLPPQNSQAQTDDNYPTLYVRVIDNTFQPKNARLLNSIFDEFRSHLNNYGIDVMKASAVSPFEQPYWQLNFTTSQFNDSLFFNISGSRLQNPFLDISPLLADNYGPDINIEITSTNRQIAFSNAVDLATAIGLLTYRHCDEANSVFQELINELESDVGQSAAVKDSLSGIYFYRAGCAILEEDFHEAASLLNMGLSYDEWPEISISYATWLAWAYVKAGQVSDATSLMEGLVENSQDIPGSKDQYLNALISSAHIHAMVSQYDDGINDLNIAIELMPAANLYLLRGQMYLATYEWDKARTDFDHIIELYPDYAPAYFHRGVLYYSILQTGLTTRDDALADFRHYLELAPSGEFAAQATEYVENIQHELDALSE